MSVAVTNSRVIDIEKANAELENQPAEKIIAWAAEQFGPGLIMTSSFGAQAALMLHLATRVVPDIAVVFIDTGYLFPETYQFAEELTQRLKLNLKVYSPAVTAARQEAMYGRMWEQGAEGMDRYHQLNKIEPMDRALRELKATAWVAALRREQTDHRAGLRTVEVQDGFYKVHPVLGWSTKQVHEYLKKHELPYHPLYEKGYKSIGDVHSTRPITAGMSERDGRFGGLKQECGLHVPKSREENQSREGSAL
ncbi:MAG: phosphoadenylyl-sulfate reductase [Phycisphaeraceae bacterium]|nr:phosphoadenylyl-sulfate reductase [Phycisphaeraceae bacterium]